jgi:hypothetical protein
MREVVLLAVCSALTFAACGPAALSLGPPDPAVEEDYAATLADWTRGDRIYTSFETQVVVHATFLSRAFQEAYLKEYARVFRPTAQEAARVRSELDSRREHAECFFMAVFAGQRDWNDFALGNSIWRLHLETDGGERVRSSHVGTVQADDLAYVHFFPYLDSFFEGYTVCFDSRSGEGAALLHEGTRSFTLELASPVGRIDLTWKVSD